jgi:hypothetical protein
MKRAVLSLLFVFSAGGAALAAACGGDDNAAAPDGGTGTSTPTLDAAMEAAVDPYAAECANAASPPNDIECTGLYSDLPSKTLAAGIQAYAPAVPLWSDYAEKERWIYLPPGTTIDRSNAEEWIFPVGTKVWKQFSRNGKRVETRLFQKVDSTFWVRTTYLWNADDSAATASGGGDMPLPGDGGIYHVPTPDECDQCHRGRIDHLLGFEEVSLGLGGATGLTLDALASQNLLSPAPPRTHLTLGDDGTGIGAPAIAWIHINCGASCHNDNSNSAAFGADMRLRLDPSLLDGRSSDNFDTRTTTIGQMSMTPTWAGQTRIVAGDPTHSLLAKLITSRGTDNPVANQMPPIASLVIDPTDTQNVLDWIAKMPAAPTDAGPDAAPAPDAGGPDASDDASPDAADTGTADDADDASPDATNP